MSNTTSDPYYPRPHSDAANVRVHPQGEAERAIARRGAGTRDPRAVGTDPTARRPRDTKPATPDA
jgi:hypothetical protein